MTKLKLLLGVIGVVQIVLGLLCLFAPAFLFQQMGLSTPPPDNRYMIGMLAARFLAYGGGMFVIARAPRRNRPWIDNMIFIQLVDLAVGLAYTASGTIGLGVSAFPMANATLFIALLLLLRPRGRDTERENTAAG